MFFLRTIFWIAVISFFLPNGMIGELLNAAGRAVTGSEASQSVSIGDGTLFGRADPDAAGFCDEYAATCSAAGAVKKFAHRQAIRATGSLHEWLVETYEDDDGDALANLGRPGQR